MNRILAIVLLVGLPIAVMPGGAAAQTAAAVAPDQEVAVTPALVREIQTLLKHNGIDPGPIDGIPEERTNQALHKFEESRALPPASLRLAGKIPAQLLAALRGEAPPPPPAAAIPPPAPAAPPPPPPAPPPDRFAACHWDPADFHIGDHAYTPESFLESGFEGSTTRAVASLTQRLDEARQIARTVGPSADREVQRQARVLGYYECRLKIEQAAAGK